jgi:UMF1 family MFS transporter
VAERATVALDAEPVHSAAPQQGRTATGPHRNRSGQVLMEKRSVWAWASYDFGNSAFATTIMAGFFPVFFRQYCGGSTLELGATVSYGSLCILLLTPVLGAIADAGGLRKRLLAVFLAIGALATASLWFVPQGGWPLAALLYAIGTIGFLGGNVFYDALVVDVAPEDKRDYVSALGYSAGYLGGGLLFLVQVIAVSFPAWFGFEPQDKAGPVRAAFVSVAIWWSVFAIPLFVFVRERAPRARVGNVVATGFRQLRDTLRHVRQYRTVALFLFAYWFYIDAVNTIIAMATDFGLAIGLAAPHLMGALLLTQFIGFPSAIAFGKLGERIGAKRAIVFGLIVYVGITALATFITADRPWLFFVLAGLVGLVQGGVQALSRSLFSCLVPPERATEFFGFYNMLGKFASLFGPLIVGLTSVMTGRPSLSILAVLVLLIPGAILLARVDVARGVAVAKAASTSAV